MKYGILVFLSDILHPLIETCNLWGWHALNCHGELARIDGRFTADHYIEILEEVMVPTVRAMNFPFPERFTFMHDNCPVHTARVVRRWFEERQDFDLMQWPSKSPDLNPIENLWAIMVSEWKIRNERRSDQLYEHVQEVWEGVRRRPQLTYNIIASMPTRLQDVIDANGSWTKY